MSTLPGDDPLRQRLGSAISGITTRALFILHPYVCLLALAVNICLAASGLALRDPLPIPRFSPEKVAILLDWVARIFQLCRHQLKRLS
jgi:hypothetical protein